MNRNLRHWPVIAVLLGALLASGCVGEAMQQAQTAAKRADTMNHLKALGLAFHSHSDRSRGEAPKSWDDLHAAGLGADVRPALEQAGYRVVLGVPFRDVMIGSSVFMIAYPVNPASDWVTVGKLDGSAQQLQRQEFDETLASQQQCCMANAVILDPPTVPTGSGPAAPPSGIAAPPSSGIPAPPPAGNP